MCSGLFLLIFWCGILDTSKGLTNVNFTSFRITDPKKYTSLSVQPLDLKSPIECAVYCDRSQCCAASYHQQLKQCYLHSSCFGDVEDATGWKILQKDIVIKTIFIQQKKSWDDSQTHCASLGGRLAIVTTEDKHELIKSLNSGFNRVWVGASDREEEGMWIWHNPTQPVLLDFWTPGEPNNVYDNEHCMTTDGYEWDDRACSDLYDFMCDIPETN